MDNPETSVTLVTHNTQNEDKQWSVTSCIEEQTIQWQKKGHTMIYKTLHRK